MTRLGEALPLSTSGVDPEALVGFADKHIACGGSSLNFALEIATDGLVHAYKAMRCEGMTGL